MTPHPIKTNGAAEPSAPELDADADLEANKENQPIDEGIEDMLAEKCDIKADDDDAAAAAMGQDKKTTTADEGIGDDKQMIVRCSSFLNRRPEETDSKSQENKLLNIFNKNKESYKSSEEQMKKTKRRTNKLLYKQEIPEENQTKTKLYIYIIYK